MLDGMPNTPETTNWSERDQIAAPPLARVVANNVTLGVTIGLGIAACLAVLSTISGVAGLSLGRSSANPFVSLHMTYVVRAACHLVAGIVGGFSLG